MTAIDDWILELQQNKSSLRVERLVSKIDTAVAALQAIQAGLTPAGNEAAHTFYAGPAVGAPALPTFRAVVSADFPVGLTLDELTLTSVAGPITIGGVPFTAAAGTAVQIGGELRLVDNGLVVKVFGAHFADPTERFIATDAVGDVDNRFTATVNGVLAWGPGNAAQDLSLTRAGVGLLEMAGVGFSINASLPAAMIFGLGGAATGLRATGAVSPFEIDFVDPTLGLAFEPGIIGGSTIGLHIAGVVKLQVDAAGDTNIIGNLKTSQTTLLQTTVALTNNAAAGAATLTNAPVNGNPTKWIPINDNGTVRNIPAW